MCVCVYVCIVRMTSIYLACVRVGTRMLGGGTSTCAGMSARAHVHLVAFWAQGSFKLFLFVVQLCIQLSDTIKKHQRILRANMAAEQGNAPAAAKRSPAPSPSARKRRCPTGSTESMNISGSPKRFTDGTSMGWTEAPGPTAPSRDMTSTELTHAYQHWQLRQPWTKHGSRQLRRQSRTTRFGLTAIRMPVTRSCTKSSSV